MKRFLLTMMTGVFCLSVNGELSEDRRDQLEDLEIAGVREDTEKDDNRNKREVLEINTFQNEDDQGEGFRIHIAVELTDKLKKRYLVDFTGNRQGDLDPGYTGEDYWILHMPYGELLNLKITGYAIQYGFMDEDEFVVFAEEFDDVKSMDELLKRTPTPFPGIIRLKHYYMYNDSEGEQESIRATVRQITVKPIKEESL